MKSMQFSKLRIIALVAALAAPAALFAGAEDDAIAMWTKIYNQALQDLQNGSTFEKIEAARLMGAHKKDRFLRPLERELIEDLEDAALRRAPINDPYVKTEIAIALGSIAHERSVPALLRAIEITRTIIGERLQQTRQDQQAIRQRQEQLQQAEGDNPELNIGRVALAEDRPGPFNQEGHQFAYSPDMFYNVSDRFKDRPVDPDAEDHRIQLEGYTYFNLVRAAMLALSRIGSPDATDGLKPYLEDELPFMRMFSAYALGGIGSVEALSAMEAVYANEADEEVKTVLAFSILRNSKARIQYYDYLRESLKSDDLPRRMRAAMALRDLAMGESIEDLREALRIEADPTLRGVLEAAIENANRDNIMPVNY